jgi:hypothetical protein
MPKVQPDPGLQQELKSFMSLHGSVAAAAIALDVDRTTLWRFLGTGRARLDIKEQYRNALDRLKTNTATDVAVLVAETETEKERPTKELKDRELHLIRQACESVLALIDAYQENGGRG